MAQYMVFYNTTAAMREQLAQIPPEQAGAGMQEWMTWGQRAGARSARAAARRAPAHEGRRDDLDAEVPGGPRHVTGVLRARAASDLTFQSHRNR